MVIEINGPEVVNSDAVIRESLKEYWSFSKRRQDRLEGHFVRSENIKSYIVLASVDKLSNKPAKNPTMI